MKNKLKNKKFFLLITFLFFIYFFSSPTFAQTRTEKTIEVQMHKNESEYTVQTLTVTTLDYPYIESNENLKGKTYYGNVMSFSEKSLGYFSASEMIITKCWDSFSEDGTITGGCEEMPEGDLMLYIPYFNNGKYADIYDLEDKKILTINLAQKATCNENNICNQPIEDKNNCSLDCANNKSFSSEQQRFMDYPFTQDLDQSENTSQTIPWWKNRPFIITGIIFIILILIFLFFKDLLI